MKRFKISEAKSEKKRQRDRLVPSSVGVKWGL